MGLRFGFGLPGPFSYSTNVFPRMPRNRTVYVRQAPEPRPRPVDYKGRAPAWGGFVLCASVVWGIWLAVTVNIGVGLLITFFGWLLCAFIVNTFATPVWEHEPDPNALRKKYCGPDCPKGEHVHDAA